MKDKIKKEKELKVLIDQAHAENKKVVFASGSFDLLHAGHFQQLERFKQQGNILVILLNSDKSVRGYKGPNRPIIPELQRALSLAATSFVDYVLIFDELTPVRYIDLLKPDVYCNGSDWGKNFLEKDVVVRNNCKIFVPPRSTLGSTSEIIQKILKIEKTPDIKAVFLDRDDVIIKDKNYLHKVEEVEFVPGIFPVLKHLQKKGYLLISISNQSGIGRKMFKESNCKKVNKYIIDKLKEKGIDLKEIFYCPHTPEDKCLCRKPGIELFLKAAKKYDIALGRSYMIGDKLSDIEAGKMCNCKTILFDTLPKNVRSVEYPDFVIKNLKEIIKIIN
jgi:rfaE bifunctional protein nucleotidyltransferase chain/domain